jgi:hypothetical protein
VKSERYQLGADAVHRLTLDPGPWLSCDACFHLVDQHVEQVLDGSTTDMPAIRAHLAGCPACLEEAASLLTLAAAGCGQDPGSARHRLTGLGSGG